MRCLLIEKNEDVHFSDMRNSSVKTLGTLVAVGDNDTIDIVANGAATCLKSSVFGHQQATAVILSALCES
jgi:hypothetical protein